MRKTKLSMVLVAVSLVVLAVSALPVNAQLGVWRDINPDAYLSPPANPQLNSVYMLSATEGWAVGDSLPSVNDALALPAIFHYDGSTWNLVPAPKFLGFPGRQNGYNLTSVTFGPPNNPINRNDGWAVGFNDTVCCVAPPIPFPNANASVAIHWDGTTWRLQNAGLSGSAAGPLWAAFMVSPTDVWAVGQAQSGAVCGATNGLCGEFWHWTGVPGLGGGWNTPQGPVKNIAFYGIFMVSSTEGWAVGSGGAIYHYFGGTWTAFTSPVTTSLRSVFMLSPTEGWGVGDAGTIVHFSTGIWTGPVSPGTTSNNLFSVFMISSTEGWAFGKAGSLLHYSGGTWTALPSNLVPTTPVASLNFNSAYFNSASDGWGVGTDGVIIHFDGSNFGSVTSPTINNFTSISFGPPLTGPIDPNDGWAVGNASITLTIFQTTVTTNNPITTTTSVTTVPASFEPTIYHYNGFMWTKGIAIGVQNNLNSVFKLNAGDAWTVGGGSHATGTCSVPPCPVILHYTGGPWNTVTPPPGSYFLNSVFMLSSTEGWAVGEQAGAPPTGIILHYTVTGGVGTWAIFPAPASPSPTPPLKSVFMLDTNEGWAVGDNATILHYTVTGGIGTWTPVTVSGTPGLSPDANLTSVFMLSPTLGWAVGGISVAGSLSDAPIIINWDGTKWEPVAVPSIPGGITSTGHTTGLLKSVFFTNPNDGWAVGYPGLLVANIMHWDGVSWNHVTMTPALLGSPPSVKPPILTSVYMTSQSTGWIVGGAPDFDNNATYLAGPGFKYALSTILRFGPFGTGFATTQTVTVVSTSTVTTATNATTTTGPVTLQITIKVVDSVGNAVQGANVTIPALGLHGVTNSQGTVTFNVPPGTYTVNISKGSSSASPSITASTPGQTFTLSLPGGGAGIPGFPIESIVAGILLGMMALMLVRRKRRSSV